MPSKYEKMKIKRYVKAIQKGWIKLEKEEPKDPLDSFLNDVNDKWVNNNNNNMDFP